MNIFQIPSKNESTNDFTIGVIDCSGSMESNWNWLADHWNTFIPTNKSKIITFDTQARIPQSNRLDGDINKHGGGGTNITAGFVQLNSELSTLSPGSNVTIIFISDGQDNNIKTLPTRMAELKGNDGSKRINFICIGVGPGFPTFISMNLREKYHNGDETLPAIFLIEHISEKAYTIKFEAIRPFLSVGKKVTINPPVCVFPWREYSNDPFERTWVMTEFKSVEIDGTKINVEEHHLNLRGINEIFRSWNQMINLESMNIGEKVDVRAKKTLALMDSILEELKVTKGIDVFAKAKDQKFNSLLQKIEFLVNKRNFERIIWFYDDVKKIASGNTAGGLSDFEAAKRIGLGTIVGKYQQKAFGLKNITPADFELMKSEFLNILKISPVKDAQNACPLRKLLREPDLDKALDFCKNQLEFFECFPLHGYPVRIVRNESGQIDETNVDIRFISPTANVELADIIQEQGGSINIPVADGKTETANSVLPLFSAEDIDLVPFLNSRLYKFLISFNLIRNPDEILDQSYVCLLLGLFSHLLKEEKIDQDLLNKIVSSLALCESNLPIRDLFKSTSNSIFDLTNEKDHNEKVKRVSSSKIILNAYIKHLKKEINPVQAKELLMNIMAAEIKSQLKTNSEQIKDFYSYTIVQKSNEEAFQTVVIKKLRTTFPKIRSLGHLSKMLIMGLLNETINNDIEIHFVPATFAKWLRSSSITHQNFAKLLEINEINEKEFESIVLAAYIAKSDESFNFSDLEGFSIVQSEVKHLLKKSLNPDHEKNESKKHDKKNPKKNVKKHGKKVKKDKSEKKVPTSKNMKKDPVYIEIYPIVEKEFKEFFKQIHKEIIPKSEAEMKDYCLKNGIHFKDITFSDNSLLPLRVCAAEKCHFYMKEAKRLDSHLNIWGISLPKGFHMIVKNNRSKSTKEIYEILSAVHFTSKDGKNEAFNPQKFEKTEVEVLEYIEKLKHVYTQILGN